MQVANGREPAEPESTQVARDQGEPCQPEQAHQSSLRALKSETIS